jgi:hypothetical protein
MPWWVCAPQAHSRVSNINFDIWIFFCGGASLWISHEKYIKNGKVLTHLGFQSKILVEHLNDWSAWVGFCTSSPQQGDEYQLWYLICLVGGLYEYPMGNILRTAKFSHTWGFNQRYSRVFNWLKCPGGFLQKPQGHSRVSNINFDIWIFFCGGGLYEYPMNNILRTAKFLPTWAFNQRYWPAL